MGNFDSAAGMLSHLAYMIYDLVKKILRTLFGNISRFGITYSVSLRKHDFQIVQVVKKMICSGNRIILID